MERVISFVGLLALIAITWAFSENRKKVDFRLVGMGVLLQFVLAIVVLWTEPGRWIFQGANAFIGKILSFSDQGAEFVFGKDFRDHFFAFSVLSTIVFFSSLTSVLFYYGIIQKVVGVMAKIMVKVMKVSGAEALASSANVFIGQTEAPLVIRPYIAHMTRSELLSLMVGGMATIAGGVMAAFVGFGIDAGHLLTASLMSAPAALVCAKILLPELEEPKTRGKVKIDLKNEDSSAIDAACRGASEGMRMAVNVIAMLIAFIALIALVNFILSGLPEINSTPITLERILGWIFSPLAFLMGVEAKDISTVGALLGKKTILNEFIAYMELKDLRGQISDRSFVISTYALCGFANILSIGIQIGGISSLVPERRKELVQLGIKALIGGSIASFMTAAIVGILI